MLLGQLASILVVGWTVNRTLIHFNELQMVEKGVEGWDKNKDYYQASYSYGAAFNGEMSKEEQNSRWYQFAKVAIQNHGALFVKNNLNRYLQGMNRMESTNLITLLLVIQSLLLPTI